MLKRISEFFSFENDAAFAFLLVIVCGCMFGLGFVFHAALQTNPL